MTEPKTYYAVGRIIAQAESYPGRGIDQRVGVRLVDEKTGRVGMMPVFATREAAEADAGDKFPIYEMREVKP